MQAGITQDSVQNKLILLFVFDKMETAMTESTILDLCSYKNNWIDFTNCKQTLLDVVDNGFVYRTKPLGRDTEDMYDLTTEGRVCLAHFYTRIPSSVRQMISDDIKRKRIEYRRRQDYVATYDKCPDGSYDVTLRIDEATKTTLEIHLNVMTRNIAKYLERSWQEKAPTVYGKLEELLIE
ncbi:MAG: DUF4364 family protein [Corallococcus sp.]|nr:DUF4364 family protein [Corallococcus sp.]